MPPIIQAVLVSRVFTVLAAIMLVATCMLLVLTPYDLSLVQGMAKFDPAMVVRLHDGVVQRLGVGIWSGLIFPVLARPAWLVPLSLGIVCVGVASTTNVPPAAHRKRRRS